jgi:predicted transposase/invertase (TIGR01784 family)
MSQVTVPNMIDDTPPEVLEIVERTMELAKTNYVDPKIDSVFHNLFAREENRRFLVSLLQSILPQAGIKRLRVLDSFFHREALDGKTCIVDIRARDQLGRCYDIEMQVHDDGYHMERTIYYVSTMVCSQLPIGHDWRMVKKTIAIHILWFNMHGDDGDYHTVHHYTNMATHEKTYTVTEVHCIELKKFHKKPDELVTLLDFWAYFLVNMPSYDKMVIPQVFQGHAELLADACKTLKLLSLNRRELETYRIRVAVMQSIEDIKRREGEKRLLEGELKGKLKGKLEGKLEGQHSLLVRLIRNRFGDIPDDFSSMIEQLKEEDIFILSDKIFVAKTLKELLNMLQKGKPKDTTPTRVSPRKRGRVAIAV